MCNQNSFTQLSQCQYYRGISHDFLFSVTRSPPPPHASLDQFLRLYSYAVIFFLLLVFCIPVSFFTHTFQCWTLFTFLKMLREYTWCWFHNGTTKNFASWLREELKKINRFVHPVDFTNDVYPRTSLYYSYGLAILPYLILIPEKLIRRNTWLLVERVFTRYSRIGRVNWIKLLFLAFTDFSKQKKIACRGIVRMKVRVMLLQSHLKNL